MQRRDFLLAAAAVALPARLAAQSEGTAAIRIGLTPVFLDNQVAFLNAWRDYLAAKLERPVVFVQRGSYREIVEVLQSRGIDFAWVCGYPFVRFARDMKLIAVPLFNGRPLYRSYVIVPAADQRSESILDLRGKVFAYSDPDSNSGFLYPNYLLATLHERADRFFRRSFFTWAHRAVVEAVARELADGGAVDGYVWETLAKFHPDLAHRTRVVQRSPEFGFPPFVAHAAVAPAQAARMQAVLQGMAQDPDGAELLRRLNLDGFAAGSPALFGEIGNMMRVVRSNADAAAS